MEKNQEFIELNEWEKRIVLKAATDKKVKIDFSGNKFSFADLEKLGVVREFYSVDEVQEKGFVSTGVVTSFDDAAKEAQDSLRVGAPFAAKGVKKWQLPIDVDGFMIMKTVFPADTLVMAHTHTVLDPDVKSGGFRMVTSGSIEFEDRVYLPGDWFFIPNGHPYTFRTDPNTETEEAYWYGHRHREGFVRVSHPKSQS